MYDDPALTGDVTQLATYCLRVAYRCACVLASRLGPLTAEHAVASAGVVSGRSLMDRRKRAEPNTDPCGTPDETGTLSEEVPSRTTT